LQPSGGGFVELESLGHPQPFHPEQFPRRGGGDDQPVPLGAGDFSVREQVLQFHTASHPDGLETVARPPVTQPNDLPHLIGVKMLGIYRIFWSINGASQRPANFPSKPHVIK
jgi:hypothetical protein